MLTRAAIPHAGVRRRSTHPNRTHQPSTDGPGSLGSIISTRSNPRIPRGRCGCDWVEIFDSTAPSLFRSRCGCTWDGSRRPTTAPADHRAGRMRRAPGPCRPRAGSPRGRHGPPVAPRRRRVAPAPLRLAATESHNQRRFDNPRSVGWKYCTQLNNEIRRPQTIVRSGGNIAPNRSSVRRERLIVRLECAAPALDGRAATADRASRARGGTRSHRRPHHTSRRCSATAASASAVSPYPAT